MDIEIDISKKGWKIFEQEAAKHKVTHSQMLEIILKEHVKRERTKFSKPSQ